MIRGAMRLTARAGFAVGLVLLALGGQGIEAAEATGLIVRQRSNGIPGRGKDEVVAQEMRVGERAFLIRDQEKDARYTIVRLDEEKIYEVDPRLEKYTVQSFDWFREKRKKADEDREIARKAILEKFSGEEQARELARRHLRADGKQVVTVERAPGETIREHRTRRTSILVNGAPAVVVYATDEIEEYEPPRVLFEFYEKAKLFPDEVIAELKKIEGFPLKIHVNVDFYSAGAAIQSTVEDVAAWPVDERAFEVPPHYERVDEFPRPEERCPDIACALCGAKIADPAKAEKVPGRPGEFACNLDHLAEYIKKKPRN